MKIYLSDHISIHEIQRQFSAEFPYLKIVVKAKPHVLNGSASEKDEKGSSTLGDCRTIHNSGTLTINPEMTVTELEQNFRDVYGLTVQIQRKTKASWIETSVTNSWTLQAQNEEGVQLSLGEISEL